MPVTKTAKRALRGSSKKEIVNKKRFATLEKAVKLAKKTKKPSDIALAAGQADRSAKNKLIHKNKAARIKSQLAKLISTKKSEKPKAKKSSSRKKK